MLWIFRSELVKWAVVLKRDSTTISPNNNSGQIYLYLELGDDNTV